MKYNYCEPTFGKEEIEAVTKAVKNKWLSTGRQCEEFSKEVAKLFGKKYGIMVNSGSSANLLALAALNLPPGSQVITPVLTFATVVSPIQFLGLTPVFVDCEPGTYLPTFDNIVAKVTPDTKALMIPNLLGNLPDGERIKAFCQERGIIYIEDSCDTLGHISWGDIVTTSFYASHIITAQGGGGMVMTDDPDVAEHIRSMRDWGRGIDDNEDINFRYDYFLDGIQYDKKFVFASSSFNFKPLDSQGAFGLVQMSRLPKFLKIRRRNYEQMRKLFSQYDCFVLPQESVKSNWMSFPILLKDAPFTRFEFVKWLEDHGIQTRPIFTGNILRQPAFKGNPEGYPNADYIMANGVLLGIHQGLSLKDINNMFAIIKQFIDERLGINPVSEPQLPSGDTPVDSAANQITA